MGTTTETLRFQTQGLEQLSQVGNVLTGINQSLQLIQQGFDYAYKAVNQFVATGSQFESYNLQFETLLGSATAAQERMEALFQFAKVTPFELPGVIEAAKALEAYGIYSERALMAAGDAASAFGKDFTETALAIAGAATGEMERLKAFGITSYQITEHLGHKMVRNTKDGLAEITQAVVELFEEKAGGGMIRMSASLEGIIGNLGDSWIAFKKIVADAGLFETIKGIFGSILETVNELFASGQAERFGATVGETIATAMDTVVGALFQIVDALTAIVRVFPNLGGFLMTGGTGIGLGGQAAQHALTRQQRRAQGLPINWEDMAPPKIGGGMYRDYWLSRNRPQYQQLGGIDTSRGGGGGPSLIPFGYMNRDDTFIGPTMSQSHALGSEFGAGYMGPTGQGAMAGMGFGAGAADMPEGQAAVVPGEGRAAEGDEYINRMTDVIGALTRSWGGYYSSLAAMSQRWAKGEGKVLKDLGNATRDFLKSGLQDFIQAQTQRAVLKQLEALADALLFGAFNPAAAASALAAAAGYAALGGVASGMVASIGPDEGGGSDYGGEGGGTIDTGGTRNLSRTAGIKTQSLNININVAHYGATMYGGDSGAREFWREHILPLAQESVLIGELG